MRAEKGITIVELLIVVVILAVMASFVMPRFSQQDERAIVAESVAALSAIRQGEEAYLLEHPGTYAGDGMMDDLDVDYPNAVDSRRFQYTLSAGAGPTFTATATRIPIDGGCPRSGANPYGGCTITLDQAGSWAASTHPNHP